MSPSGLIARVKPLRGVGNAKRIPGFIKITRRNVRFDIFLVKKCSPQIYEIGAEMTYLWRDGDSCQCQILLGFLIFQRF